MKRKARKDIKTGVLKVDYSLLHLKEDSLEVKLKQLVQQQIKELKVISVFMTEGFEYSQMRERARLYKPYFKKLWFSAPILKGRRRVRSFAAFLISEYALDKDRAYVFVGHGLNGSKNRGYFLLEKYLKKLGYGNAKVFLLKGRSGRFKELCRDKIEKKVTVIPLLISCGKHIKEDIFGGENSFCSDLEDLGFEVEKRIVSLNMSERFRKEFLYDDK